MPVVKQVDKVETRREQSDELVKKLLSGELLMAAAGNGLVGSDDVSDIQARLMEEARKQLNQQSQLASAAVGPEPFTVFSAPPRESAMMLHAISGIEQRHSASPGMMAKLGAFAPVGTTESSLMPLDMAVEHEKARKSAAEALAKAVELAEQKKRSYNPKASAEAVHRRDMDFYERYEKLHQHHQEVEQVKRDIQQARYGSCHEHIQRLLLKKEDDDHEAPLGDEETYESVQRLLSHLVVHRARHGGGGDGDDAKAGETETERLKRKVLSQRDHLDELRKKNRELSAALRIAAMESKSSQELLLDRNEEINRLRGTIGTLHLQVKNLKGRDEMRNSIRAGTVGGSAAGTAALMREMDQLRLDYNHMTEQNLLLEKEVRMLRQGGARRGGGSMAASSDSHRPRGSPTAAASASRIGVMSYQSQTLMRARRVAIRSRFEAQERQMMSMFDADANRLEVLARRAKAGGANQGKPGGGGLAESVVVKVSDLPISAAQRAGLSLLNKPPPRDESPKPDTPGKGGDDLNNTSSGNAAANNNGAAPLQHSTSGVFLPPGGRPQFKSAGRAWNVMRQRLVRIVALSRADILRREEIHIQKQRSRVAALSQDLAAITAERDLLLEKVELMLNNSAADENDLSQNSNASMTRFHRMSMRVVPGSGLVQREPSDTNSGLNNDQLGSGSIYNVSTYDPVAEMDMERLRKELYELKHIMKLRAQDGEGSDIPLPDTDKPIDALFDVLHGRVRHLELMVQQREATIEEMKRRFSEDDGKKSRRRSGGGGTAGIAGAAGAVGIAGAAGAVGIAGGDFDAGRMSTMQDALNIHALEKSLLRKEAEIVALDKDVREREKRIRAVEHQLAEARAMHELGLSRQAASRVVGSMLRWRDQARGGVMLARHASSLREKEGISAKPDAVADEEQQLLTQLIPMLEDPDQQRIVQNLLDSHERSKQEPDPSAVGERHHDGGGEKSVADENKKGGDGHFGTGWSLAEAVEDADELAASARRRAGGRRQSTIGSRLAERASETNADRRWFVMRRTFLRLITVREEAWRGASGVRARAAAAARVKELFSSLMQLEQKERSVNRPAFCVDAALETVSFSTATLLVSETSRIEDVEREYVALRQLLETRATHERQLQSERDQAMADLRRITRESSEQEQAAVAKTITEHGALSIVHRVAEGETAAMVGAAYGISDYATLGKISRSVAPPEPYTVAAGASVWLPILNFGVLQSLGDDLFGARSGSGADETAAADTKNTVLVLRHHVQPNESLHAVASRVGSVAAHVLEACTLRPLLQSGDQQQQQHPKEVPIVDIIINRKSAFQLLQQHYKNTRAGRANANEASGGKKVDEHALTSTNFASSGPLVSSAAAQMDRIFARITLPNNAHTCTQLFARQYNVDETWLQLLNQPLIPGATVRLPFHFTNTYISLLPELTRRGAIEVYHSPGARRAATVAQVAELYGASEEVVRERVAEFEAIVAAGSGDGAAVSSTKVPGLHEGSFGGDDVDAAEKQRQREARLAAVPLYIPVRNLDAILALAGEPETQQTVRDVMTMARAEEVRRNKIKSELVQQGGASSNPETVLAQQQQQTEFAMRLIDRANILVPAAAAAGVDLIAAAAQAPITHSTTSLVTVTDNRAAETAGVPSLYDEEKFVRPSSVASSAGGRSETDGQDMISTKKARSHILRVRRTALLPSRTGSPAGHHHQQQQPTLLDVARKMGKLREDIDVPNVELLAERMVGSAEGDFVDIDVVVQLETETAVDVALNRLKRKLEEELDSNANLFKRAAASAAAASGGAIATTLHAVVPLDGSKTLRELARLWLITMDELKAANPELNLDAAITTTTTTSSAAASGGGGSGGGEFCPSGRIRVPVRSEADLQRLRLQTGEFYAVEKIRAEKRDVADTHIFDKVAATYGVDGKKSVHVFDAPLNAATPIIHVRAEARHVDSVTGQISFCLSLPQSLARLLCGGSADDSLRVRRAVECDVAAALAECPVARNNEEMRKLAKKAAAAASASQNSEDKSSQSQQQHVQSLTGVFRIQTRELRDRNDWIEVCVTARSKRIAFAIRKFINEHWISGLPGAGSQMPHTIKLLHVESAAVADVKDSDVEMLHLGGDTVRELKIRTVDLNPALHIVKKGDSLRSLAIAHGIGVDCIMNANPEAVQQLLGASFEHDRRPLGHEKLLIPRGEAVSAPGQTLQSINTAQVRAGETLVDVVTQHNCLLRQLKKINLPVLPLFGPVHLVRIPEAESTAGWRDPVRCESTTVRCTTEGESLVAVALRFGADVDELYFPNMQNFNTVMTTSSNSSIATVGGRKMHYSPHHRYLHDNNNNSKDNNGAEIDDASPQPDLFLPKKSGVRIPPSAGGLMGVEENADHIPFTVRCTDVVTDGTDSLQTLAYQWAVSAREIALYNPSVVRVRKGAFITIITRSKTGAATATCSSLSGSAASVFDGESHSTRPDVDFTKLNLPMSELVTVVPTVASVEEEEEGVDGDDATREQEKRGAAATAASAEGRATIVTTRKYMKIAPSTGELVIHYVVKPTDTVVSLAAQYAQPVTAILDHNPELAEHYGACAVLVPVAQEHINDVLVSQPPHLFGLVPHKPDETIQTACKKYSAPFAKANDATAMLPESIRQHAHLIPIASATSAALCRQQAHPLYFVLEPNRGESLAKMAERCLGSATDVDKLIPIGKPLGSLGLHAVQVPVSNATGKALLASGEALLVVQDEAGGAPQVLSRLPEVSETMRVTQTAFIAARERALANRKAGLENRAQELDRLLSQVSSRIDATEREFSAVSELRSGLLAKIAEEESKLAMSQNSAGGAPPDDDRSSKPARRPVLLPFFGRGAKGVGLESNAGGGVFVGNNAFTQTDLISVSVSEHMLRTTNNNSKSGTSTTTNNSFGTSTSGAHTATHSTSTGSGIINTTSNNSKTSSSSAFGMQYIFSPKVSGSGLAPAVGLCNASAQTVAIAAYQNTSFAEQHAVQAKKLQELQRETSALQAQLDNALSELQSVRASRSKSPAASAGGVGGGGGAGGGTGILEALQLEIESKEASIKSIRDENTYLHAALADAFESTLSGEHSAGGGGSNSVRSTVALRRGLILARSRAAQVRHDCADLKALVIRLFGGTMDHMQDAAATAGTDLFEVDFSVLAHLTRDEDNSSINNIKDGGARGGGAGGKPVNRPRFEFEIRESERRAVAALVGSDQDAVAPLGRTRSMPCMRSVLRDPSILDGPAHRILRDEDWAARQVHDYVVGKLAGSLATGTTSALGGSLVPAQHYGTPSVRPTLHTGALEVVTGITVPGSKPSGRKPGGGKGASVGTTVGEALNEKLSEELQMLQNLAAASKKDDKGRHQQKQDDDDEMELKRLQDDLNDKHKAAASTRSGLTPQRRLFEQFRDTATAVQQPQQPQQRRPAVSADYHLKRFVPMMQVIQALQRSTVGQPQSRTDHDDQLSPGDRESIERARAADAALHHETMGIAWQQLSARLHIKRAKLRMEDLSLPAEDRRAMNKLVGLWKHWLARWTTRRRHILYQRRGNIEGLVARFLNQSNIVKHAMAGDDYNSFTRRVISPHRPTTSSLTFTSLPPMWLAGSQYPFSARPSEITTTAGAGAGGGTPYAQTGSGRAAGGPMFAVGGGHVSPSVTSRSPLPATTARGGTTLLRPMLPPYISASERHHQPPLQPSSTGGAVTASGTLSGPVTPTPPVGKSSRHFERVTLPNDKTQQ